jgi:hypothetical protein
MLKLKLEFIHHKQRLENWRFNRCRIGAHYSSSLFFKLYFFAIILSPLFARIVAIFPAIPTERMQMEHIIKTLVG